MLLLQQETEGIKDTSACFSSMTAAGAEWGAIAIVYQQENARVRALEWLLPIDIPYRLVPRAEILADDARRALMYPGTTQRRPAPMEYAAVSAVGFNAAKTKAIVSVSFRDRGFIQFMEIRKANGSVGPSDVIGSRRFNLAACLRTRRIHVVRRRSLRCINRVRDASDGNGHGASCLEHRRIDRLLAQHSAVTA